MSRTTKIAIGILIVVVLLKMDYWNVRRKEKLLSGAVSAIGGRTSSLPFYPFGSEYVIVLTAVPTDEQLDDLEIANHMHGVVGIGLKGCELSEDDVEQLHARLPLCSLRILDEEDHSHPLAATVYNEGK